MIFDIIVIVAVLISAFIALLRGFIRELLTIVGVGGGVLAAIMGGPFLLPAMNGWLHVPADRDKMTKLFGTIPMDMVAVILSYGIIFVVVVIVLSVLSYFLSSGAKAVGLGPVDRVLGFVFGVARAALLLSLLYLPLYKIAPEKDLNDWFKGSLTRPYVQQGADLIAGLMPNSTDKDGKSVEDKAKDVRAKGDDVREKLDQMNDLKAATDKAGAALENAKQEARERFDDLKSKVPAEGEEGYKEDQRKDLNQLIRTNQ